MKVFVCPRSDEMGKFQGVVQAFPDIWRGHVLDVGCRSRKLKRVLSSSYKRNVFYFGVDIHPPADAIVNMEHYLPFDDESFDVVVALDVLEHLDNLHQAFGEICRVSRSSVVLSLPNAYELRARIKFFLGLPLSGKYGMPIEPPEDRHRWLFSLKESRIFTHIIGRQCGFRVTTEGCLVGPRRSRGGGWLFVSLLPNLLSPWYIALLNREKSH